MNISSHSLGILAGGICTLAIYSYLIKENQVYRFFEHLFIGLVTGLGPVLGFQRFIWPKILSPLLGLDIIHYPDGSTSGEYNNLYLIYIPALLFGLLYYTIFSRRFNWLAKLVIGFGLGVSAGFGLKGWFVEMIPQLASSMKPLVVFEDNSFLNFATFNNIVFVYTLLAVMLYFFFTFKRENAVLTSITTSGRWLMMLCFGAFFGSTVMARMALLVERVQFMFVEWGGELVKLFL